MIIWKPLTKYRYSEQRNEVKYHTDLALEEGEKLEDYKEFMEVLKVKTPNGKVRKIHLEIADEEFNKEDGV